MNDTVTVIGGGFAGVEAAKQLTKRGIRVRLYEMKPVKFSPAHRSEKLCEVVCSNSFKSANPASAAGLLKNEMAMLGSVCIRCANETAVPAGGALAVDRDAFSDAVTREIEKDPLIDVVREEVTHIPDSGVVIVAAGPLASDALSEDIKRLCGGGLSFFDAAAPIITAESVDMSHAFTASRYDKGGGDDYINCPMNKAEYEAFYEALSTAERAPLHDFDADGNLTVYEGCMPIEVMAGRGPDTMRFGPLRPVGLTDPRTGHRPWANVQLRSENRQNTMYNLVGFQTNLKFGEQKRVFSLIPGLEHAEFVRYGVMHRNTFLNSPKLMAENLALKAHPNVWFAGQITGFEGYMESAACGLLAARGILAALEGKTMTPPPADTMCGALIRYITSENKDFQPMGSNMGILPPLETHIRDKRERYAALADRAVADMKAWLEAQQ